MSTVGGWKSDLAMLSHLDAKLIAVFRGLQQERAGADGTVYYDVIPESEGWTRQVRFSVYSTMLMDLQWEFTSCILSISSPAKQNENKRLFERK